MIGLKETLNGSRETRAESRRLAWNHDRSDSIVDSTVVVQVEAVDVTIIINQSFVRSDVLSKTDDSKFETRL
jgi:hypothetical protein